MNNDYNIFRPLPDAAEPVEHVGDESKAWNYALYVDPNYSHPKAVQTTVRTDSHLTRVKAPPKEPSLLSQGILKLPGFKQGKYPDGEPHQDREGRPIGMLELGYYSIDAFTVVSFDKYYKYQVTPEGIERCKERGRGGLGLIFRDYDPSMHAEISELIGQGKGDISYYIFKGKEKAREILESEEIRSNFNICKGCSESLLSFLKHKELGREWKLQRDSRTGYETKPRKSKKSSAAR
ncbi:hypothetical protein CC80DRAFT_509370 [Byssothecium circinans]|uniref:Uncharacterized protein n=1 Tax=Byssothecium circinans TaxID=147558 RepID=A0A6A5TGN2_9PLEO|nr:hypothetical protein CC80DRAFT_509370 [Byssothecium circinans]